MQTIYKNQPSFNLILDVPPVEQGIRQFWTLTRELLDELMNVVSRPKFRKYISQKDILQLFQVIEIYCLEVVLQEEAVSEVRDAKDLYLLSLADTVKADFLLTGDKDLLVLGKHGQTTILTLSDFLIRISGQDLCKA